MAGFEETKAPALRGGLAKSRNFVAVEFLPLARSLDGAVEKVAEGGDLAGHASNSCVTHSSTGGMAARRSAMRKSLPNPPGL